MFAELLTRNPLFHYFHHVIIIVILDIIIAKSSVRISVSTSASHALEPGSIPGRSME
jgi:hypothetical protein